MSRSTTGAQELALPEETEAPSSDQPGAHPGAVGELVEQPRLADARLAHERDYLALAGRGQLARPIERRQFVPRPTKGVRPRPADACRRVRAAPTPTRSNASIGCDRPFTGTCPSVRRSTKPSARPAVAAVSLIVPGLASCSIRLARCDGRADRVVVHAEVVADRAHQHLARVQPDPRADLYAVGAAQLGRLVLHGALDRQRRVAGAHGVVLVRDRRAEQRHDAVAQNPVDRALVAVDGVHHHAERRIQNAPRVLRIGVPRSARASP